MVRKLIILAAIILFASATVVLASWGVSELIKDDGGVEVAGEVISAQEGGEADGETSADSSEGGDEVTAAGDASDAGVPMSGEAMQYPGPDYRMVTETQRHQNFFVALAEGRVKRMDVTATDFQPVGDPNTSYVYFTLTTSDGNRSDGMFVMKFAGGLWRIAAVRQLAGDLGGGTNYMVPATFEDDLARELNELQEFLTKVAEGRLAYMTVDNVVRNGDCETILLGTVVSKGGKVFPAEMTLRKNYGLWHITNILCL